MLLSMIFNFLVCDQEQANLVEKGPLSGHKNDKNTAEI